MPLDWGHVALGAAVLLLLTRQLRRRDSTGLHVLIRWGRSHTDETTRHRSIDDDTDR